MQELIQKIISKTGITADQAEQTIETVKEFIKEKVPMVSGAVDKFFTETAHAAGETGSSLLDKISDVIPGDIGEKIEQFAKDNSDKAEDVIDSMKDKLSGLLGKK